MRNHKGLFITFESTVEGIGKSTQAHLLASALRRAGFEVVLTKEPGGTMVGQMLRTILLDPKSKLSKATELFLLMADRAQHYKEVLKPGLKNGKIIICDRYVDSTLAYQGAGRGWKNAFLWRLHHATTGSLLPNLTVVLHGTPHINRSEHNPDRFEQEGTNFFTRVEQEILHVASKDPRYVVLDGNVDADTITEDILRIIAERRLLELVE